MHILKCILKGVSRKISRVGGWQQKKDRKNSKKVRKIALLSLFKGGGGAKKKTENSKRHRKIALFILSLLYLYHV